MDNVPAAFLNKYIDNIKTQKDTARYNKQLTSSFGCRRPEVRGRKKITIVSVSSAAVQNRTCCKAEMAVRDVIRKQGW